MHWHVYKLVDHYIVHFSITGLWEIVNFVVDGVN